MSFTIPNSWPDLAFLIQTSPTLVWHSTLLPISIISTFHAIRVALFIRYKFSPYHSTHQYFPTNKLQFMFVNLVLALGGGILTSFWFGGAVSWLGNNITVPLYCFIHYLIFYSPLDIAFQSIYFLLPILNPILIVSDGICRGLAISTFIEAISHQTKSSVPSYIAMISGGFMAACGGGILADTFGLLNLQWQFRTPNFLSVNVPIGIKTPFILSLYYTIMSHPELPFYNYIILILSKVPMLKPILFIIPRPGSIHKFELQAFLCVIFVVVLLYEEYVLTTLFPYKVIKVDLNKGRKLGGKSEVNNDNSSFTGSSILSEDLLKLDNNQSGLDSNDTSIISSKLNPEKKIQ